jgi:hypothetical protein
MEDELCRPRANLRKINLILTVLAHPAHLALADLTKQRKLDFDRLVNLLGDTPASALSVPLGWLAARRLGVALRLPLRERGCLAFAAATQLLDDLLQLSDPTFLLLCLALLLSEPASEFIVLLKDFLVSRHV